MTDLLSLLNGLNVNNPDDHVEHVREKYIRAPFGYPGNKQESLAHILPRLPKSKIYVEPFGGSGAVLLARSQSKLEVFNDRHSGITAFYRCIRDDNKLKQLISRCELCVHSREEFLWCKETWEGVADDIERAARWWYMVTCSFSNKGMAFGRCVFTPAQFGGKLKNNLSWFFPAHARLQHVQIENMDALQLLRDFDSDDTVFYLDPPYYGIQNSYQCGFSNQDHEKLIATIFGLKGFVALSGYDNTLYDSHDWSEKHSWEVKTTMVALAETETNNLKGKNLERGFVTESLWIKDFA